MGKPRTDAPKPAPFPVGTRLRYRGKLDMSQGPTGGEQRRICYPGIEVEVYAEKYGWRGTGRVIDHDDETGEPYYDETHDFVSVYRIGPDVPGLPLTTYGRCIGHDSVQDWEVIK
jgi:hypothetical protein